MRCARRGLVAAHGGTGHRIAPRVPARQWATAIWTRSLPRRFITATPQGFSQLQRLTRIGNAFATAEGNARTIR